MSRVIKFRAWTGKRMLTIDPLERKGTLSDLVEDESWKVMQFTGLTDRNGVEIYEGDIVTADDILCVVEWQKAEWTAAWSSVVRGAGRQWRHPQLGFRVHEVIGNIYENSELLEAKP